MQRFEHILTLIVKGGFYLLPFIPLIVSPFFLFPYITGKNFAFRIIVDIMATAWLILLVYNPRQYLPKRNIFLVVYALFFGWIIITALLGADLARSFWSNFERMEGVITHIHLFVMVLMAVSVLKTSRDWHPIIILTLIASAFLTLYGILERAGIVITGTGGDRLFATLGNSIYLAEYLMVHLFIIALLFIFQSKLYARMLLAALWLFELYIFFAASTRGALLGLIVGSGIATILYLFLTRHIALEKGIMFFWIRRGLMGAFIVGIALAATLFVFRDNHAFQKNPLVAPVLSLYQAFENPTESTQGARLMIWGMAFKAAKERPFFGWGPENFIIPFARHYNPSMFGNEPWFDRVHNMFFEWFVAGGIIGGTLYLALLASLFFLLTKGYRRAIFSREEVVVISGLLIAYMIQNMFVFDTIVSYLLFFGLGAYLAVRVSGSMYQVAGNTHDTSYILHAAQNDPRKSAAAFLVVLAMGAFLIIVNVRPMIASASLIDALRSVGEAKPSEEVIAVFEQTFNRGTFGKTEARERLADILITVATVQGVTQETAPAFLPLLDLGIRELEKEIDEHPENVRPMLFLGKMYHLRAAITGRGGEQAIAMYDRLLATAPDYVQGYLGKAETYLVRGEDEKAFVAVEEGLRRVGTQPPAAVVMIESAALAHVLANDFEGALMILKKSRIRKQDGNLHILDTDRVERVAERAFHSKRNAVERKAFFEDLLLLVPTSVVIPDLIQITDAELQAS